jgi:phosphate transport system permease protein
MPVLIVSARNSIKSVPKIIRDMAFAMGASRSRVVFGLVLPSAMPGILTGIILTLARLIGETAPLLIVGMVAFIGSAPSSVLMPSSALPVQIYLWSSSPDYILVNKASALILILIAFLLFSNIVINIIRKRFEVKW